MWVISGKTWVFSGSPYRPVLKNMAVSTALSVWVFRRKTWVISVQTWVFSIRHGVLRAE